MHSRFCREFMKENWVFQKICQLPRFCLFSHSLLMQIGEYVPQEHCHRAVTTTTTNFRCTHSDIRLTIFWVPFLCEFVCMCSFHFIIVNFNSNLPRVCIGDSVFSSQGECAFFECWKRKKKNTLHIFSSGVNRLLWSRGLGTCWNSPDWDAEKWYFLFVLARRGMVNGIGHGNPF